MVIPPQHIPPSTEHIFRFQPKRSSNILEPSTITNSNWHLHRPKFQILKVPTIWLLTWTIAYSIQLNKLYIHVLGRHYISTPIMPPCRQSPCYSKPRIIFVHGWDCMRAAFWVRRRWKCRPLSAAYTAASGYIIGLCTRLLYYSFRLQR